MLVLLAAALVGCATGGVIGGAYYAPQYSWSEFYAVTDGRNFQVIVSGNPFPALTQADFQRRFLPVMQASKPRPNLTFTYDPPPEPPHFDSRRQTDRTAASPRACATLGRHRRGRP
jgi:hypothetical protein